MSNTLLVPGYVRWTGTAFVTDPDVEIVGPPGPAGEEGPPGPSGGAGLPGIDNIIGLKAFANPLEHMAVSVNGYYAIADGGGGNFYWDSSSADNDNGGTIIQSDIGGVGRWIRINDCCNQINIKVFGAIGDGIFNNTSIIQATINYAIANNLEVHVPTGIYVFNSTLTIATGTVLKGSGHNQSILRFTGAGTALTSMDAGSNIYLELFTLDTNSNASTIGIDLVSVYDMVLNEVYILGNIFGDDSTLGFSTCGARVLSKAAANVNAGNITFNSCVIHACAGDGLQLVTDTFGAAGPQLINVNSGRIQGNAGIGIHIPPNGYSQIIVNGTDVEGCSGGSIKVDQLISSAFKNCHMECPAGFTGKLVDINPTSGISSYGVEFCNNYVSLQNASAGDATSNYHIYVTSPTASDNISISNNVIVAKLGSHSKSAIIAGPHFNCIFGPNALLGTFVPDVATTAQVAFLAGGCYGNIVNGRDATTFYSPVVLAQVPTIAALRNFVKPTIYDTTFTVLSINVAGYYADNDGGGGLFIWNPIDTTADNGGTIIAPTGVATGRWNRELSNYENVKSFGAKGDGITNDTTAINAAVQSVASRGITSSTIFFPQGVYLTSGINLVSMHGLRFEGVGQASAGTANPNPNASKGGTQIRALTVNQPYVIRTESRDLTFSNLTIDGYHKALVCLLSEYQTSGVIIENVNITQAVSNTGTLVQIGGALDLQVEHMVFNRCRITQNISDSNDKCGIVILIQNLNTFIVTFNDCFITDGYENVVFRSAGARILGGEISRHVTSGITVDYSPGPPDNILVSGVYTETSNVPFLRMINGETLRPVIATGTSPPTVTITGTPIATYRFRIEVVSVGTGALGNTTIRWSKNNGLTWDATGVTTATNVTLGSTGITAHFNAGPYSANNVWTATVQIDGNHPIILHQLDINAGNAPIYNNSRSPLFIESCHLGGDVTTISALSPVPDPAGGSQKLTALACTFDSQGTPGTFNGAASNYNVQQYACTDYTGAWLSQVFGHPVGVPTTILAARDVVTMADISGYIRAYATYSKVFFSTDTYVDITSDLGYSNGAALGLHGDSTKSLISNNWFINDNKYARDGYATKLSFDTATGDTFISATPTGLAGNTTTFTELLRIRATDGAIIANGPYLLPGTNTATIGDIRSANNTVIVAARNAANNGNLTILSTDGSNNTLLNATNAALNLQVNGANRLALDTSKVTAFLPFVLQGSNSAATGDIRASNNTTIIAARRADNAADIPVLGTTSGNTTSLVGGVGGLSFQTDGGFTRATITSSGAQLLDTIPLLLGTSNYAASGDIRAKNATTIIAARNAANNGDLTILQTDGSNNTLLNSTGGTLVLTVSGSNKLAIDASLVSVNLPFRLQGATSATTGDIRSANNTTIISTRNAANSANITVLKTDGSDQITIGDITNTSGVFLTANSSTGTIRFHGTTIIGDPDTTARLVITPGATTTVVPSASTNLAISLNNSNPATTGSIRAANNTTIISARNAANSANITVVGTDSSNTLAIGDINNTATLQLISAGAAVSFSSSFIFRDLAAATALTVTPLSTGTTSITAAVGVTSLLLSQSTKASDVAPANITISPQAPFASATGTNRIPGSLIVDVAAPTNGGTSEARLKVTRAGVFSASIGPYESSGSAFSAIYLGPALVPSATNFAFLGDGASVVYLNAPSGGTINLSFNGTSGNGVNLTTSLFKWATSGITWGPGAGSPEGAVTAPIGSIYSRSDGGTDTTLYRKESGAGNTGWVAVVNSGGVPTSRTLTAGAGLTGGGDLTANRTFDVVAADGTITVNADSIEATGAFGAKNVTTSGYVQLAGANPATAGNIRAANATKIIDARNAANNANLELFSTDASDNLIVGDGTNTTGLYLDSKTGGGVRSRVNGATILAVLAATITASAPIVLQGTNPATTGDIRAVNATTILAARNQANNADLTLLRTDTSNNILVGQTSAVTLYLQSSSGIGFDCGATEHIMTATYFAVATGAASFTLYQADKTSNGNAGATLTIQAQNETGTTSTGGALLLTSGTGTTKAGTVRIGPGGSILIEAVPLISSQRIVAINRWTALTTTEMPANTGDLVMYIGDANTAPTASPVSGGILYSEAGAGKWYGSNGTVTTFGPADPHCPRCGRDYVFEAQNTRLNEHLAICWSCFTDEAEVHGMNVGNFAFIRQLNRTK